MSSRRQFLAVLGASSAGLLFSSFASLRTRKSAPPRIACQQYPWGTFYARAGKSWNSDLQASVADLGKAGFQVFEPSFATMDELNTLRPLLQDADIGAYSCYVNSVLHDPAAVEGSIDDALRIAKAAKALGIRVVVTNPTPISWGGPENKNDEQLLFQAQALDRLGYELRKMGMMLAYHNHDAEMRMSAREFHHMMQGTDPANVHLCLDAHWVYRGSGNSEVALFDIVRLYAPRIVELHLRQSQDGIWTEAFGPGDINYERLAATLLGRRVHPHLVLEQAVEEGSPHTLDAVAAHRQSLAYAEEVFADFRG